jgi:hypothetical protein
LAQALSFEFYDGSALAGPMGTVLRAHPDVLGDLYLALDASDQHLDPHAAILDTLLTLDPGFGAKWLDRTLGRVQRPAVDDYRDYTSLWHRPDWENVVGTLARQILADDRSTLYGDSYLGVLLRVPDARP